MIRAAIIDQSQPPSVPWAGRALAILALWAIIELGLLMAGVSPVLQGDLGDSDAYLQLVKVQHLYETGDWYANLLPRSNWPQGEAVAWTRSLDSVLLAGAALFRPFFGSFHDALFWFSVVLSPLCALACAFAAGWMPGPLLGPSARFGAALLLLTQPGILSYTYARGPNHHGILFLAFIAGCGFILRALKQPEERYAPAWAGAMIGIGLWISVEFLLPLVVILSVLGGLWLFDGQRWTAVNRRFAAGFLLSLLVLLPVEHAFGDLLTPEYDRLSIVHLALAGILLGFWIAVPMAARRSAAWLPRFAASAIGVIAAGAIMTAIYPKFFAGPLVDIDPTLVAHLIAHNADWQSAIPSSLGGLGRFLFYAGLPILCLAVAARMLWLRRGDAGGPAWLFLTILLLVYAAMTLRSVRFAGFAEIAALIPLMQLLEQVDERLGRRHSWQAALGKCLAITALILGFPAGGGAALAAATPAGHEAGSGDCRLADIAPILNDPAGLGARQRMILAAVHSGPEILYRTSHAVLATPMFRNPGIMDAYHILAAGDDASAKAILERRRIDLILLCPLSGERLFFDSDEGQDTLYNRLVAGRNPAWAQAVPLPDNLAKRFLLFAVRSD
jgi:hypothetical protein